MEVTEVTPADFEQWLDLALKLWPDTSSAEMQATLMAILHSPREAGFLIKDTTGTAIGFMNLSLRYEYVPGATQSPIAYVEGIYVAATHRHQGVGKTLIQAAEQWAIEHQCVQLASDALLENTVSHQFHTQVGFQEVERVVTFVKNLLDANCQD